MHFDADPDSPPLGAGRWETMAAGGAHNCAIDNDERLHCWGRNVDGETGRSSSAVLLPEAGAVDSFTWSKVAAGGATTCGIRKDGALLCWGNNNYGQVGDNANVGDSMNDDRSVPVPIGSGTWIDVAVGGAHACAIHSDRTVWCWGNNDTGELGDGTTTDRNIPTKVASATLFRSISIGDNTTCGIAEDNSLYCWGANDGAVFTTSTPASSSQPLQITGEEWRELAIARSFGCGITMGGFLRCWGRNTVGQVGDGTQMNRTAPTAVAAPDLAWVQVSAHEQSACARSQDGRVFCWGESTMGQLETFDDSVLTPHEIVAATAPWKHVTNGDGHTCLLDNDDRMWCVGKDGFSQLGDGGTSSGIPVQVPGTWRDVTTGKAFTCAVDLADGKVKCAGRNHLGQLGTGNVTYAMGMTPVVGGNLDAAVKLAAGIEHACAQSASGSIYCWGANYNYQLGLPGEGERYMPTMVGAGTKPTANMHTCAINNANSHILCWGTNDRLQINDSGIEITMPTDITPLSTWKEVTAGRYHTCGIESGASGAVWCKGDRYQIGDPTPPASHTGDLFFTELTGVESISAGAYHTCAAKTAAGNNEGYCWGSGYAGQLGQGDVATRFAPAIVAGAWKMFAGGDIHTCGITTTGSLSCWGDNTYGQLGTTSPDSTTLPATVSAGPWKTVSAAEYHTCAITEDDQMFCWGNNNDGQLANGAAWKQELVNVP